ncbi:MAG: 4Fe-4S binding protein [Candidatus Aminicenantes bacterium]|nr:4Fe-4S binding protein [Candidatus Aminicenantes bacterium]
MKRKIIQIKEELCNGCGQCLPNCPEGALQIIDGKARLISDLFCDGLGACVNQCPMGAIEIVEREAEPYDEKRVMENLVKQGKNVILAHLKHLQDHGETKLLREAIDFLEEKGIKNPLIELDHQSYHHSCPSARTMAIPRHKEKDKELVRENEGFILEGIARMESQLSNWPIQMKLISPFAPYLEQAHILLAADCVPCAYPNFHFDFLKGKVLIILCPKLDTGIDGYIEKLTEIIKANKPSCITVLHMEVPCCFGLARIAREAIKKSGIETEIKELIISIRGEKAEEISR